MKDGHLVTAIRVEAYKLDCMDLKRRGGYTPLSRFMKVNDSFGNVQMQEYSGGG